MRKLHPTEALSAQLQRSPIGTVLSDRVYSFEFIQYDKKEDMNLRRPVSNYLKFILSGTVKLWIPRPNGGEFRLYEENGFCVLGDMELLNYTTQTCHTALTTVESAELYVPDCKFRLMNDPVFLRFLAVNSAGILSEWLPLIVIDNLKDRLLYYLSVESNGVLTSLDQAATRLNCSNRQLHRILVQFQEEGILVKNTRGQYELLTCTPSGCHTPHRG